MPSPPVRLLLLMIAFASITTRALPVAAADDKHSALILATGDPSNNAHVRATARDWLQTRGTSVVDGGLKAKDAAKLAECLAKTPTECADQIAATGADRVWMFSLKPTAGDEGTDIDILLRVYGSDGRALATGDIHCERCGKDVLDAQVEKVLDTVSVTAAALTSATTVLRIRTEPAGGIITVDGASVGTAVPEVVYNVLPGSHEIRATKDGYEPGVRRVDLQDGEEKVVTVTMEPSGPIENGGEHGGHRRNLWPYLVGGVGVAALGTGITLFALHEPAERDGDQQFRYRDRLVPAIVVTGVGVAACSVATYLFIRSRREPRNGSVVPAASVSSGGVVLGLEGSF